MSEVVHNRHLTLTGTVHTLFQRATVQKAVRHIPGLKEVANRIVVTPAATPRDVQRQGARALHRDATRGPSRSPRSRTG